MAHTVYIAGPDLFYPDWPERAALAKSICARHGLTAVLPVAEARPSGPGVTSPAAKADALPIFVHCCTAIRDADGVIANLTPFRGWEPDSGTVVECAWAASWGKPVIGYTLRPPMRPERTDAEGRRLDAAGAFVEQFGLSHNLMVHGVCLEIVDALGVAVQHMAEIFQGTRFAAPTGVRAGNPSC